MRFNHSGLLDAVVLAGLVLVRGEHEVLAELLQRGGRHPPARPAAIEIMLVADNVAIGERNRLVLHSRGRNVVRLPMLHRIIHLFNPLIHQRLLIAHLVSILINKQYNLIALIDPKLDLLLALERRQVPRVLRELLLQLLLRLLLLKLMLHHCGHFLLV